MLPPTLKTKHFVIKAYSLKDEDRFIEIATNKEALAFMGNATDDKEKVRGMFRRILKIYRAEQSTRWFYLWGIYDQNDKLLGHLELKETENTEEGELEIVYMVHPDARRQGLMTEVLLFLKNHHRIWKKTIIATIDSKNFISINSLEKWGIEKRVSRKKEGGYSWKFWMTMP